MGERHRGGIRGAAWYRRYHAARRVESPHHCRDCGCLVFGGKHQIGPTYRYAKGEGWRHTGFRLSTRGCPADWLSRPWMAGLLEDWDAATAFPSIPLSGHSLSDYDAWTLDAILILRAEDPFIATAHQAEASHG